MTIIDYERLELIVTGDINESIRDNYDITLIVKNATIEGDNILVKGSDFFFLYDKVTYEQVAGGGGVSL